ncbi:hypothetical protein F7725_001248 [Dissostichus mawsoni]|uniref:Protein kinase domain-containing protein n=1 Tax=Dissostichus mawsoni TaxID=36200 RepID=A0A7J5ZH91_DISMA|nr:hypothetical protein F7725_001248 [Dissostichus mawsoni]
MLSDLSEVIRNSQRPLTPAQVKGYMMMLLKGVAFLHHNNIMHRVRGGYETGSVSLQQRRVYHAVLQGKVHGEVRGRSLQPLAGGSTPPLRDGQLRVVSRKRRGEEVRMEESLQRRTTNQLTNQFIN